MTIFWTEERRWKFVTQITEIGNFRGEVRECHAGSVLLADSGSIVLNLDAVQPKIYLQISHIKLLKNVLISLIFLKRTTYQFHFYIGGPSI